MTSNWKAGDLALCIKQGPWSRCGKVVSGPKTGEYLTVSAVSVRSFRKNTLDPSSIYQAQALSFPGYNVWCKADRFIKITPEAPDEFDNEIINGYKGKVLKNVPV